MKKPWEPEEPKEAKQPRSYYKAPPDVRRTWLEYHAKRGIFPEFHRHKCGIVGFTMETGRSPSMPVCDLVDLPEAEKVRMIVGGA